MILHFVIRMDKLRCTNKTEMGSLMLVIVMILSAKFRHENHLKAVTVPDFLPLTNVKKNKIVTIAAFGDINAKRSPVI